MVAEHQTNSRYTQGCRCILCGQAHAEYGKLWNRRQRELARLGKLYLEEHKLVLELDCE